MEEEVKMESVTASGRVACSSIISLRRDNLPAITKPRPSEYVCNFKLHLYCVCILCVLSVST